MTTWYDDHHLGGFADFYVVQTTSPGFIGYDDLSVFVVDARDVRAQPSLWDALGLRGNQPGAIEIEGAIVPAELTVLGEEHVLGLRQDAPATTLRTLARAVENGGDGARVVLAVLAEHERTEEPP